MYFPLELWHIIGDYRHEFAMIEIRKKHPMTKLLKLTNHRFVYLHGNKKYVKSIDDVQTGGFREAIHSIIPPSQNEGRRTRRIGISEYYLTLKTVFNNNFQLDLCTHCWVLKQKIIPISYTIYCNKSINVFVIEDCLH